MAHYIHNGQFTLVDLNAAISSQNYGYSEVSDKPSPLRESVFQREEGYKLKYKAAQARLFLRLIPFILCSLIPVDDDYYTLVVELIELCQIVFTPVITLPTINLLKGKIGEHFRNFKKHFPNISITPKQHYMIHIPSMIKQLGPMIRHSCFGFESAHNYFKELARKQNFKNLPKSLAERCQLKECRNFAYTNEAGITHPLFSTEMNFGPLSGTTERERTSLRAQFDIFGLLPGINLQNTYKTSWVVCYGTELKRGGIIICRIDEEYERPVFGSIHQIWTLNNFLYFEYKPLETLCFSERFQAYHVKSVIDLPTELCSYESLVDFNVPRIHEANEGEQYVPVKYDIVDLIEQHLRGENPLKY